MPTLSDFTGLLKDILRKIKGDKCEEMPFVYLQSGNISYHIFAQHQMKVFTASV